MAAIFTNFLYGTLTADPGSGGTTLTSAGLASMPAVASPDFMWVVLDPTSTAGAPEIVKITAHTASATTATMTRGQQGTTARAHGVGMTWVHGITTSDIDNWPNLTISDTAPSLPAAGDLWYESDTGILYIYYDSYWVEASGGMSSVDASGLTGTTLASNVVSSSLTSVGSSLTIGGRTLGGLLLCTSSTRPTGTDGLTIYETDTNRTLQHDGTNWIIMFEPPNTITVTPRQNGSNLTYSGQTSWYQRSNGYCEVYSTMTITGTGTITTPFDCTIDIPDPMFATGAIGSFLYYDSSYGSYVGAPGLNSTGTLVSFACNLSNWTLGGNPSFAAANTDTISFSLRYRMNTPYL